MKSRILTLIIGSLFIASSSIAQNYTFRVLVNKGDNSMKTGSSDWQKVKTGARLNDGDILKVVDGGYMGLVHSSGKTKEIKKAGEYDIKDLSSSIVAGSQNIATKYADYVLSKMSPQQMEQNRKKYASVTGAVERGENDAAIKILMPTSGNVLNDKVIVRWDPVEGNPTYQVTLKNIFEEVIMMTETTETTYTIDFSNPKLEGATDDNLLIVSVNLKGNEAIKSKPAAIERISKDEAANYEVKLNALKSDLGEASSINSLILAEFYEENNLILDALTSYETAIQISPDVPYFKEAYDEFLMRNQLDK